MGDNAFSNTPDGAAAIVTIEALSSFGGFGDGWNGLTLSPTPQLAALLAQITAERDAAVATARTAGQGDVTSDPASYSLFTEEQINAMTVDPTVGQNAAGNMQVDISFIHSTDLENFTPFALSPDWVSVVDWENYSRIPTKR